MFLSCCKDFSEHSSDDRLDPFFASQSNMFSLLNCPAIIKRYGSLSSIWEGEDEAFIRSVKSEISTMRYQTTHLQCLLVRLLQTKTLNFLNRNNPLNKNTIYSRTNNVRIYAKGRSCEEPSMILENEVFVSGVVKNSGVILICFQERAGQESNFFQFFLMTRMESGVLIYGMPMLGLGVISNLSVIVQS